VNIGELFLIGILGNVDILGFEVGLGAFRSYQEPLAGDLTVLRLFGGRQKREARFLPVMSIVVRGARDDCIAVRQNSVSRVMKNIFSLVFIVGLRHENRVRQNGEFRST
jgi:hypothetical protein